MHDASLTASLIAPAHFHSGGIPLDTVCRTLDTIGVAVLVVDRSARLRFRNDVARRLIGGELLRLDAERLLGLARADTSRLHGAIEAVIRAPTEPPRTIKLQGLDGFGCHCASVASAHGADGEAMAIVALAAPCATIAPDRLRQAFGLTPAETRLLSALVTGERLADYAERTGVKRSTAKTHLRGLFQKVGEGRQADLIRRVMDDALLRSPSPLIQAAA